MDWLRELARRLGMLMRRRQFDADLEEEVRLHLELREEEQFKAGMTADEARAAARRRFGNATYLKEESHIAWGWEWFETLAQDVRYGARMLRKSPGFAAVAVFTLALGIGTNTAIFSVINGVLLRPLPYKDSQQIVVMKDNESLPNVIDIHRQASAFSVGGAINAQPMDYTSGPEPLQIRVGLVNSRFFEILGIPPVTGRTFSEAEDVLGGLRLAVVSYSFWQSHLGGDSHALGKLTSF